MSTSWDSWTEGSLSRLRREDFLRTRFLGRSRKVDLLGPPHPQTGRYLSRLRHDNLPATRSLGRLRQVYLLGPLGWIWVSSVFSMTSAG